MKLIPDEELILTAETDRLKTSTYVDTLQEIIKSTEPDKPFTIGLFGGWGSGKSSIVQTLADRLKNVEHIETIFYDAWKYSKDAFRRSFLLEVKRQLDLDPQSSLEEFYYDKVEDIDHQIKIRKLPVWFSLPIIIFGGFLVVISLFSSIPTVQKIIGTSSGVIISLFTILLQAFFQNLFVVYKVSQTRHKTFSPEQFEEVFKEAVKQVFTPKINFFKWFKPKNRLETHPKKIVIIIDNIDRCHKNLATELLLTVKNFLEAPGCIFVIPVDDEAIKSYLDSPDNAGEEFLRKFFNTTVRIKKHSPPELFDFTKHLIDKYNLKFSPNVARIVSQEFAKNPRRIIQFLNNLSAELTVGEYQEKTRVITKGSVTDNIDFLAKISLIREEWPELYDRINSASYLMHQINSHIKNREFKWVKEKVLYTCTSGDSDITLTIEQYWFLSRTLPIRTTNIDPFLRLQDLDKDIPDELFDHINNGDWQGIKNFLGETGTNIEKLWNILKAQLDSAIIKRGLFETEGFSLLSLLFEIIADKDYEEEFEDIHKDFEPFTSDTRIRGIIPNFNPQHLLNYSAKLSEIGDDHLVNNISTSLNQLGGRIAEYRDLVKEYVKSYVASKDAMTNIKTAFSELITTDVSTLEDDEYRTLLKKHNAARYLIKKPIINDTIASIENNYQNEGVTGRVKMIQFLNTVGAVTAKQKSTYLQKIHPFANNNSWPQTHFWLDAMVGFIRDVKSPGEIGLWTTLQNRHKFFFQQFYPQNKRGDIQSQCVLTLMSLLQEYHLASGATKTPALQYILEYFKRNESKEVYLCANRLLQDTIDTSKVHNWPFADAVIARFDSIPDFEGKSEVTSTLLTMLKKSELSEETWTGLQPNQIQQIIHKFFTAFFSDDKQQSEKAQGWITKASEIKLIESFIKEDVNLISETSRLKKVLPFVSTILDRATNRAISDKIVRSDTSYKGLTENVQTVIEIKYGRVYAKASLLQLLNETTIQTIEPYKSILQVCVDQQQLFEESDAEKLIDDKFIPILGQEFPHAIFACEQLLRLEQIPESKHSLLRTLVGRIRVPDDDDRKNDHQQILKQLKKLLKKS